MPEQTLTTSPAELDLLEQVRQQQGLPTVEDAAEWLAKTRLRRMARLTTGRGRALYPVGFVATNPGAKE